METPIRESDHVVIGAGLSGAVIYHHLSRMGKPSLVLEKSKGVGGRIANRRLGGRSFSHGVQSFQLDPGEQEDQFFNLFERRYFESLGQSQYRIHEPATQGIKQAFPETAVLKDSKVMTIGKNKTHPSWMLTLDTGEVILSPQVFVTAPAPQALELVRSELPPDLVQEMARVVYSKRIILFSDEAHPDMRFMDDSFSEAHFEKSDAQILAMEGSARFVSVKKWRYEKVLQGIKRNYWSQNGLHLCGDYFNSRMDRGISDSFRSSSLLMAQFEGWKTST